MNLKYLDDKLIYLAKNDYSKYLDVKTIFCGNFKIIVV